MVLSVQPQLGCDTFKYHPDAINVAMGIPDVIRFCVFRVFFFFLLVQLTLKVTVLWWYRNVLFFFCSRCPFFLVASHWGASNCTSVRTGSGFVLEHPHIPRIRFNPWPVPWLTKTGWEKVSGFLWFCCYFLSLNYLVLKRCDMLLVLMLSRLEFSVKLRLSGMSRVEC
jgi:hypothetical protein